MKTQLTLLLISFLCSHLAQADTDWEPAKDEDGIRVYTRQVDGWDIEEFKAICVVKAKRYLIYQKLIDVAHYTNWYPDIMHAELTAQPSEHEFYSYTQIDVPWPSDDRDGECRFVVTHNSTEKTTLISMTSCEKYKSRNEHFVRMTKGQGFWKLTSKEDGSTVVHYQYLSDPGGSVPAWLTNLFIVDNPFETVKALRAQVES